MSGFFKNYVWGDGDRGDFTPARLPRTRRQLFFKLLRTRLAKLFLTNLLGFAFFAPAVAWKIGCSVYLSSLDPAQAEDWSRFMSFFLYTQTPVRLLLCVLLFFGVFGTLYNVRCLAWGMPFSLFRSFFKGIRQSAGQAAGLSVVFTVFSALFSLAWTYMTVFPLASFWQNALVYCALLFAMLLALCLLTYAVTLCALYKMNFFALFKNAFRLTVKYFGRTALAVLLAYAPSFIWYLFGIYLQLAGAVLDMFFGVVYTALVLFLFTGSVYDVHINREQYPDFYRKGLYVPAGEVPHA